MWTWLFWRSALERAIKTGVQGLLGMFAGGAVGFVQAPWGHALNVAAMMAVLSILTSIGSGFIPADPWTSPSAVRTAPAWSSGVHRRPEPMLTTPSGNRWKRARAGRRLQQAMRDGQGGNGTGNH